METNNADVDVISMDGKVRVTIEYIGEGVEGEYDPDNPDDIPLLRFSVSRHYDVGEIVKSYYTDICEEQPFTEDMSEDGWMQVSDASYCTQLPATLSLKDREIAGKLILSEVEENVRNQVSVKKIGERLSWIGTEELANNVSSL